MKVNELHSFTPKIMKSELSQELSNVELPFEGKIPTWLKGYLVRNGPIRVFVDGKTNEHWFDGLAMLHSIKFANGKVIYNNKFLRTDAYKQVFNENSLNYLGFDTKPSKYLLKRLYDWFWPNKKAIQNANINVGKLKTEYVAYTEIPAPVRFTRDSVETLGLFKFFDKLPQENCWICAHPHTDLRLKETINYLIEFSRNSYYTIYRIADDSSERKLIAKIPIEKPAYMHSFSITKNYIILIEYPLLVKPFDIITSGLPFIKNYKWEPEKGTRFLIIDRKTGEIVEKIHTRPFFSFHHVNAFEDENQIIIDLISYPDVNVIDVIANHFEPDSRENVSGKENSLEAKFERFIIDNNKMTSEVLLNKSLEFPRINSFYDGHPYRFAYLVDPLDDVGDAKTRRPIYKLDIKTKKTLEWFEDRCYPGEPVFIASPEENEEDDGVILSVILDLIEKRSFLLILDAKNLKELARVTIPHAIPPGLHGQFFT